jgi:ATP-dependent exoDNAse (exonuclease V) beta subunit
VIEAQARTFELTELQRQRLGAAIDRWFNSDIAANFFASGHVSAEVPFTVCIPAEQAQKGCGGNESRPVVKEFYLEGEIDALSINEDSAWIIDYKTGGNASEAAEALQKKHMFQAQCYAYALLSAGMKIVRATFVRVEQVASVDGNEPQTVEYNFSDSDAASLQKAIIEAYTALHKFS